MSENKSYRTQVTLPMDSVTQADRDDLARAATMLVEAKRLRRAVLARIRQRRSRKARRDGGNPHPGNAIPTKP